jgi:hypothetical protein
MEVVTDQVGLNPSDANFSFLRKKEEEYKKDVK